MRAWIQKVVLCAALLWLYGCKPSVTIALPTIAPTYTPTKQNTRTPTSKYRAYWKEFREPVDGWGIAVPVDWIVQSFNDSDDDFNHLTILNYDDNSFGSDSGKEAWSEWANQESVYLEILKVGGYGEYSSLEAGIRDRMGKSEMGELVEIETVSIGREKAVRFIMKDRTFGRLSLSYAFQLNAFEILVWVCNPESAWERTDVQGILASIALTHDADIVFPDVEPGKHLVHTS